jgi:hypothetical protein
MRLKTFFVLSFLLLNFSSNAQYFMAKNDFIETYKDTARPSQLILRKVPEEKLLAGYYYAGTQLKLFFNDDSEKTILSKTIKISGESAEATEITKFWQNKRPTKFGLDNLDSVSIKKIWISWTTPYFDIDSLENLHKIKTDSLKIEYASRDRLFLELVPLDKNDNDTLRIVENAIYHLEMVDGEIFRYGVIQEITSDSIVISREFDPKELSENDSAQFCYAHNEISKINLLRSGGVGKISKRAIRYTFTTKEAPKGIRFAPCGYRINKPNGTLNFYRFLLNENGYRGINFNEGNYSWDE